MNKLLKGVIAAGLCVPLAIAATGCNKKKLDGESRPLQLSIGALDKNFNPFTFTSENDGKIAAMTQIGMLAADENGELAYGDNWPTAVLDMKTTMYNARENGEVVQETDMNGRTEYEFVIKNGIMFSDGKPLTIKDVLFNLYVYLDPAYTGSSTIYSTDIQGLKEYRSQDPNASTANPNLEAGFVATARNKIQKFIEWSRDDKVTLTADEEKDLERIRELYHEEAESDWTMISSSWRDSYKGTHTFTETWQAYLYSEGIIEDQMVLNSSGQQVRAFNDKNGNGVRDDGVGEDNKLDESKAEQYYTTLDPKVTGATNVPGEVGTIRDSAIIKGVEDASTEAKIDEFLANPDNKDFDRETAKEQLIKDYCVNYVYTAFALDRGEIQNVLSYRGTASTALEMFTGDARTKYFNDLKGEDGKNVVENIKGISTYKTSNFNGKDLGESHDVLKVVINGIDPKAVWNFGFTVAPLHYYSGEFKVSDGGDGKNYVEEFNGVDNFGLAFGNSDFFSKVIKAPEKNSLPVGAGVYKAKDNSSSFSNNNLVRFERNDNFHTTGKNIENAKIKYVTYAEHNSDNTIMNALVADSIDFAMPNATPQNYNEIANKKHLEQGHYNASGYGYVGVNPKFVPELEVRQAIMSAMDTSIPVSNYYERFAQTIHRPMSLTFTNYYPTGVAAYEPIAFIGDQEKRTDKIETLLDDAGYVKQGQYYVKDGKRITLTFTIAGSSTDHPAYQMFTKARDILNDIGFDITVTSDPQALRNLATGNVAVWAAAWSSGIDPDPYQLYHKNSKASSVKNWNYNGIVGTSDTRFTRERAIIDQLSALIDKGRQTLSVTKRADIYGRKDGALDLIMSLAVELPTYQRSDLYAYNTNVINGKTLAKGTSYLSPIDRIWEVEYV